MSETNPHCGVELRDAFIAYSNELSSQMKMVELPPDLYKDWLRYRLDRLKATKVANLTPGQAALLYQHMQAAFPLTTVPLDDPRLPVTPVPVQMPLPSVTPEFAERVWRKLFETEVQNIPGIPEMMSILQAAADPCEHDWLLHRKMEGPDETICAKCGAHKAPEQEQFWARVGLDGVIHPETLAAHKKDVATPKQLEETGHRVALVELREVSDGV